jgi:hypothetical protein
MRVIPTLGGCAGCPQNAKLQPGMPMPRHLQGLAGLGVAIPVPEIIQPPQQTQTAPAGSPRGVSIRTARRMQVGGIMTSATFAAAGLIASQRGRGKLASQLALFSVMAGAIVSISQLFVEEEGY